MEISRPSSAASAIHLDGYILAVHFDNGERGTLDVKPYLDFGPLVKLKDPETLRKVRVSFDTVEREAGAALDPEFVMRYA